MLPNPIPASYKFSIFPTLRTTFVGRTKINKKLQTLLNPRLFRPESLSYSWFPQMSHADLEEGSHHQHRRSLSAGEGSVCFSDAEEGSCYSQFYSTTGGSYDENSFACVSDGEIGVSDSRRVSSVSECSVEIECGVHEIKVHLVKVERDCRICHLGLESNSNESGIPMELGCSCKGDLAAAHKQCADTWFKIKGNKICEICHSIARNVVGANDLELSEHANENELNGAATTAVPASVPYAETHSFWHGHRFLNFLLACMVFAFVISWLFHFNMPSS